MCGRIIQSGAPYLPGLTTMLGTSDDPRVIPTLRGAPSQLLCVI